MREFNINIKLITNKYFYLSYKAYNYLFRIMSAISKTKKDKINFLNIFRT